VTILALVPRREIGHALLSNRAKKAGNVSCAFEVRQSGATSSSSSYELSDAFILVVFKDI
jgi:hypothetical protein